METKLKTIKLGQVSFINCLPFKLALENSNTSDDFSKHSATPSELNQLLRNNDLDVAPISSFEYLSNKDQYELIDNISISTLEKAMSVIFFFNTPLEELNTVHITDKSASSVALLKIILNKKYNLDLQKINFQKFSNAEETMLQGITNDNKLLIGDEALLENSQSRYLHTLDLGQEWYQLSKHLPMVFAVWAINKRSPHSKSKQNLNDLFADLKSKSNRLIPNSILEAHRMTGINEATLLEYFKQLNYDFTERHRSSLELYNQYLIELDLLSPEDKRVSQEG